MKTPVAGLALGISAICEMYHAWPQSGPWSAAHGAVPAGFEPVPHGEGVVVTATLSASATNALERR